jgi:hypothetical protein
VHREDLARVRELVVAAGGAVLGAVLHHTDPPTTSRFGLRRPGTSVPAARVEPPAEPAPSTAPEHHPVP